MAKDNKSLGKFLLAGIPVAPRGVPQIEVSFEIDVNGILQVSAEDKGTGKNQNITISNTGGLSNAEVEKMRQDAEAYAERDRRRVELVELKNQAENLFYNYESTLKEREQLIREELKQQIKDLQKQIEAAFDSSNMSFTAIENLVNEFRQKLLQAGTDVYQQASSGDIEFSEDEELDINATIAGENIEFDTPKRGSPTSKAVVKVEERNKIAESNTAYEDPTMFDETTFEDYEVVD